MNIGSKNFDNTADVLESIEIDLYAYNSHLRRDATKPRQIGACELGIINFNSFDVRRKAPSFILPGFAACTVSCVWPTKTSGS